MMLTEYIERELSNVWNKYVSNDADVWNRMFDLDYRGKLESMDQRARYYVVKGILSELSVSRPAVLDVGCGCGTAYPLISHGVRYHGIDISEAAVAQASEAFHGASFQVTDFASYSPAAVFDAVLFNEVLYYFPVSEIEATLRKALALLDSEDSLLVVSMSDNAKAKVVWGYFRPLGEPLHDINVRTRVRSSRWTVRAWRKPPRRV